MDALASVALGGKAFVATLNKPWRPSLRGRIGKALGTPWEALGTRSWCVARRSSFVVGRSSLVLRRLSFGAGRWLVDIVGIQALEIKNLRMLWQVLATP